MYPPLHMYPPPHMYPHKPRLIVRERERRESEVVPYTYHIRTIYIWYVLCTYHIRTVYENTERARGKGASSENEDAVTNGHTNT